MFQGNWFVSNSLQSVLVSGACYKGISTWSPRIKEMSETNFMSNENSMIFAFPSNNRALFINPYLFLPEQLPHPSIPRIPLSISNWEGIKEQSASRIQNMVINKTVLNSSIPLPTLWPLPLPISAPRNDLTVISGSGSGYFPRGIGLFWCKEDQPSFFLNARYSPLYSFLPILGRWIWRSIFWAYNIQEWAVLELPVQRHGMSKVLD
jgi:hypothetical protein